MAQPANAEEGKREPELEKKLPKSCQQLLNHKAKYDVSQSGAVTFYPSPHLQKKNEGTKQFKKQLFTESEQSRNILKSLECDKYEAIHNKNVEILQKADSENAFLRCAEIGFFLHYPLKIKPSHIWILILQSITEHIDRNAEKLKNKFVSFKENKKSLLVQVNTFEKGKTNQKDWNFIVNEFVKQIDQNTVKDTIPILESDFSTSTMSEKISTKICIMNMFKSYFEYDGACGCGFPSITLDGNKQDWLKLMQKTQFLLNEKMEEKFAKRWSQALLPVLQRFIDAFDGKIDCLFWNSMLKRGAVELSTNELYTMNEYIPSHDYANIIGDNNPTPMLNIDSDQKNDELENADDVDDDVEFDATEVYSGWLNVFYPFLTQSHNEYCVPYSVELDYVMSGIQRPGYGSEVDEFPIGISCSPMRLKHYEKNEEYQFKIGSGFLGITQCKETLQLSPVVGWFVAEKNNNVKHIDKNINK